MSPDTSPAGDDVGHGATGADAAGERSGVDPLADPDAGVAVDDDPDQVDLNSEQWDTE